MNVSDNVDAYTGAASVSVELINIPGRNGLDLSFRISCSSHVFNNATNSNLTDATGVLGLGWALPVDAIISAAGTAAADVTYMLVSGSESGRLVCKSLLADGTQLFQCENFQFWTIVYTPALARWQIVKEDGTSYIYGDVSSGRNTVHWAVAWGAWRGASVQLAGQSPRAALFCRSEVSNRFGDSITWEYDSVVQTVGSGTAAYTQAVYLSKVTAVTGDYIALSYLEKENDVTNQEYIVPHTNPAAPNAWQDAYQTRYLNTLTLYAADGTARFVQQFQYASTPLGTGAMAKRLLTGIIETPAGSTAHLPGLRFVYCGQASADQVSASSPFNATTQCLYGAIKQVTTANGGTVAYQYGAVSPALSTRSAPISPPVVSGVTFSSPCFHFQDAYVIATWLGSDTTLKLMAYTWDDRWVAPSQSAGLDSLPLASAAAYSAVPIAKSDSLFGAYSQNQVHLFHTDRTQAGMWITQNFPTTYGSTETVRLGAGDSFIAALGLTGGVIKTYWFNGLAWIADPTQTLTPGTGAATFDLAVKKNYVLAAGTVQAAGSNPIVLQLTVADITSYMAWNSFQIARQLFQVDTLSLAAGDTFAIVMLAAADGPGQDAQYVAVWWNETGATLQSQNLAVINVASGSAPTPAISGSSVTIGQLAFRFDGATWNYQNLAGTSTTTAISTGDDVVVRTLQISASQFTYDLTTYNPNTSTWSSAVSVGSTTGTATVAAARTPGKSQYVVVGGTIYSQQPNGSWASTSASLPTLSGNDALSPVLAANNFIVYQNAGNVGAFTLINSTAVALPQIAGASVYAAGASLVGNTSFITYTGTFGAQQSTLTLNRAVDGAVTGAMQSYAVTSRTESNGYQSIPTSYVYDAACAFTGHSRTLRSNHTTSCAGSSDGVTRPSGWIDSYYFNGMNGGDTPALAYPVDATNTNATSFYSTVRGSLYCMQSFPAGAASGAFQTQDTYYLWVTNLTLGTYVRTPKATNIVDGVPTTSLYTFSSDTGLATQESRSNFNSNGQPEQLVTQYRYFWEEYDPTRALNLLTPIIQTTTQTITGTGSSATTTTTGTYVTTYTTSWGITAGSWAPDRTYMALAGNAPAFNNWTSGDPASGWQRTATFLALTSNGQPLRVSASDGVISGTQYDVNQHMAIAAFVNADPSAGEASYYGFDPYEDTGPWGWAGSGALADYITTNDCHTGAQCLQLPSAPSQANGPFAVFLPAGQQRTFVFGLWFKTPQAFDPTQGTASFSIVVSTAGANPTIVTTLSIALTATLNQWGYAQQAINLPAIRAAGSIPSTTPLVLRISGWNKNSAHPVLVDNLRFSPVDAVFAASVYDPVSRLVTATVGNNGEISRTVYDAYDRPAALVGPNEQVKAVAATSYSRDASATDTFVAAFPNTSLSLATTQWSSYYDFRDAATNDWLLTNAGGTWAISGGNLGFTGTATDPLGATAALQLFAFTNFGMRVVCLSATGNAGIGNGDAFVFWNATSSTWNLVRRQASGAPTVVATSTAIGFRGDWIFVIVEGLLLFFAGGVQVFAYDYQDASTSLPSYGKPALMATGAATFDDVVVLDNPQVAMSFLDGAGTELQRIALLGYSGSGTSYTTQAMGIFQDSLGRPYVSRNSASPALALAATGSNTATGAAELIEANQGTYLVSSSGQTVTQQQYLSGLYGYDYTQTQYETSPLSRVTAVTIPREAGSTAANFTTTFANSAANATVGQGLLPSGQEQNYPMETITNSDGITGYRIFDQTGKPFAARVQVGASFQTTSVQYDAFGNAVTIRQPNYYNPPMNSQASSWVEIRTYTFSNLLASQTTPDTGTTQYLYDSSGRLRFVAMADGAAATPPLFLYVKYDALGRAIEQGYIQDAAVAWASLANQVNVTSYPSAPSVAAHWVRQSTYDIAQSGSTQNLLGRLTSVTTNWNSTLVTQTFAYDASGNIILNTTTVPSVDPATYTATFTYDNQNNQIVVAYPIKTGETPFQVGYYYDRLGRLAAIGQPVQGDVVVDPSAPASGTENLYATYMYSENGLLMAVQLNNQPSQPGSSFTRTFTYDAPGWLTQIDDPFFNETSAYYEQPGADGVTRHSGLISQNSVTYKPAAGTAALSPYSYAYAYDSLSRLTQAQCAAIPPGSLQVGTSGIDANGNMLQVTLGGVSQTFSYQQSASSTTQVNNQLFSVSQNVSSAINFTTNVPGWSWGASNGGPSASQIVSANGGKALQLTGGSLGHYERLRFDTSATTGVLNLSYQVMTPTGFSQLAGDAGWYLVASTANGTVVAKPLGTVPDTAGAWQSASLPAIDVGALLTAEAGGAAITDVALELRNYKLAGAGATAILSVASIALTTQASITSGNYTYSPSGFVTKSPSITLITYDPVLQLPLSAQAPGGAVSWLYDGSRARASMTASDTTRTYLRDPSSRPLRVNTTTSGQTQTTYNVYGPQGLLGFQSGSSFHFALQDRLGSTRLTVDNTATRIATFDYLPFGGAMRTSGSSLDTDQQFTGQVLDPATGLYAFPARGYDPAIGRFYAPDNAGQYPSPYLYGGGDWLNLTDPDGNTFVDAVGEGAKRLYAAGQDFVDEHPYIAAGGVTAGAALVGASFFFPVGPALLTAGQTMWAYKWQIALAGTLGRKLRNSPTYSDFFADVAIDIAVSSASSHVAMRTLRGFDAAFIGIKFQPVIWTLGVAAVGGEGVLKGHGLHYVRTWFGRESVAPDAMRDALSNIIAHALFSSLDYRTALSPRGAHGPGGTDINVIYNKFPALRNFRRNHFLRGFLIPYKGIATGRGSPSALAAHRHAGHHWNPFGFDAHFAYAASENQAAIQYLERLMIQVFQPAARVLGPNPGTLQLNHGIFTPTAQAWLPDFLDEFVVWHFRYAAQHMQTPVEGFANATVPYVNALLKRFF